MGKGEGGAVASHGRWRSRGQRRERGERFIGPRFTTPGGRKAEGRYFTQSPNCETRKKRETKKGGYEAAQNAKQRMGFSNCRRRREESLILR